MHAASPWESPLACRFLAEFLDRTIDIVDDDAHQRGVQAFLDELKPWLHTADCPFPRPEFTVFSKMALDPETEEASVVFTPEGLAYFRAWLRRRGLDPVMGTS